MAPFRTHLGVRSFSLDCLGCRHASVQEGLETGGRGKRGPQEPGNLSVLHRAFPQDRSRTVLQDKRIYVPSFHGPLFEISHLTEHLIPPITKSGSLGCSDPYLCHCRQQQIHPENRGARGKLTCPEQKPCKVTNCQGFVSNSFPSLLFIPHSSLSCACPRIGE